ncbi:MAG: hypothetical protein JXQ84_01010 [Rhodospirillaceae bacterium]|nr:hypothetical protein [Rhodospirillaceae bacterium]
MNIDWLLTGHGPVFASSAPSPDAPIGDGPIQDEDLLSAVINGVITRCNTADRNLGQIAARIFNQLLLAYDNPEERRIGLKLALSQINANTDPHAQ